MFGFGIEPQLVTKQLVWSSQVNRTFLASSATRFLRTIDGASAVKQKFPSAYLMHTGSRKLDVCVIWVRDRQRLALQELPERYVVGRTAVHTL